MDGGGGYLVGERRWLGEECVSALGSDRRANDVGDWPAFFSVECQLYQARRLPAPRERPPRRRSASQYGRFAPCSVSCCVACTASGTPPGGVVEVCHTRTGGWREAGCRGAWEERPRVKGGEWGIFLIPTTAVFLPFLLHSGQSDTWRTASLIRYE